MKNMNGTKQHIIFSNNRVKMFLLGFGVYQLPKKDCVGLHNGGWKSCFEIYR